jgi:hypothetical protein
MDLPTDPLNETTCAGVSVLYVGKALESGAIRDHQRRSLNGNKTSFLKIAQVACSRLAGRAKISWDCDPGHGETVQNDICSMWPATFTLC